jgi:hypothetical protein
MSTGRGHQTQWAAQFAVASELCKRGYEVAFTSGHTTPIADLMAVSPIKREMFLVDVKGLYRKNPWLIKRKEPRKHLFYILAYVPTEEQNEYFILSQEKVHSLINLTACLGMMIIQSQASVITQQSHSRTSGIYFGLESMNPRLNIPV